MSTPNIPVDVWPSESPIEDAIAVVAFYILEAALFSCAAIRYDCLNSWKCEMTSCRYYDAVVMIP